MAIKRLAGVLILMATLLFAGSQAGAAVSPDADLRIGVAPFGVDPSSRQPVPDVAELLAVELARVPGLDVSMRPRRDGPIGNLRASEVRSWASKGQLESVVVGETARLAAGGLSVRVELRSGHSGAPQAQYWLEPAGEPDLEAAIEKLAVLIVADSRRQASAKAADGSALPAVSAAVSPKPGSELASTGGASGSFTLLPGVDKDDPIHIESSELEMLPDGRGRRVIFKENVVVEQGDIRLLADHLEAVYPEGASQPARLIARGHVTVTQGDRRASCNEATYERDEEKITCRGKAVVFQGCDQVRGREIEFDLAREIVRVIGQAAVLIHPSDEQTGECIGAAE